jgi:hypothetical protein
VGVLALDNPPYLLVDPIAAGSTTHDDVKKIIYMRHADCVLGGEVLQALRSVVK